MEIWVLLLEKAWAKIYGSYHRIEVGNTGEALPVLTGAPSQTLTHSEFSEREMDKLWHTVLEADVRNLIMTTAAISDGQEEQEEMAK